MELARPESSPPQARVVEGHTEYSNKHEQYVFTGDGTIRAGARWSGGDVNGVNIPGSPEDEEMGVGAMEEAEAVVEGSGYPVGEGLTRAEALALMVVVWRRSRA